MRNPIASSVRDRQVSTDWMQSNAPHSKSWCNLVGNSLGNCLPTSRHISTKNVQKSRSLRDMHANIKARSQQNGCREHAPHSKSWCDLVGGQVEGEVEGRHKRAGPDGELAHHRLEPLCASAQIHRRILPCNTEMTPLYKLDLPSPLGLENM